MRNIKLLNLLCLHSKLKIVSFGIPFKLNNEAPRNYRLFSKDNMAKYC